MTNWKDHERRCAALIGGKRYGANTGGKVDVESETIVAQCKEVRVMPLNELSRQVVQIEAEAKKVNKVGVVFVKSHEGRGFPTPALVVMRMETWWEMVNKCGATGPDNCIKL